jgi:ubiquinone/menaquinone biosynthesis C-methylase UbiE
MISLTPKGRNMGQPLRADYDAIASQYDLQPFRTKQPDPELASFLKAHPGSGASRILDLACGTGNQLIANRSIAPGAWLCGVDRSAGMLQQGRSKDASIAWVRADVAWLPLSDGAFDYASCQFAFHHFLDKSVVLAETHRLLRTGGRFVLHNMCPEECEDWLYYRYFPEARSIDKRDFWPVARIAAAMRDAGFHSIDVEYEHIRSKRNLVEWLPRARRRDICSQLLAISDECFLAGIRRLEAELVDPAAAKTRLDHYCRVTIRADK